MASLLWTVVLICVAAPCLEAAGPALGAQCTPNTDTCDGTGVICEVDKCVIQQQKVGRNCTGDAPAADTATKCGDPASTHLECIAGSGSDSACKCVTGFDGKPGENCTAKTTTDPPKTPTGTPVHTGLTTTTQKTTNPKAGAVFGACQTTGDKCSDGNAECDKNVSPNVCKCKQGFYAKGSSCTKAAAGKVGGSCTDDKNCTANDKEATCKNHFCSCKSGYQGDAETGCVEQGEIGGLCSDSQACKVDNTYCQPRGGTPSACQCKSPYHMSGKKCVKSGSATLTSVTSLVLVALFWASRHLLKE